MITKAYNYRHKIVLSLLHNRIINKKNNYWLTAGHIHVVALNGSRSVVVRT